MTSTDDDWNAEQHRQHRRQRGGWCTLTLAGIAATTAVLLRVLLRPSGRDRD